MLNCVHSVTSLRFSLLWTCVLITYVNCQYSNCSKYRYDSSRYLLIVCDWKSKCSNLILTSRNMGTHQCHAFEIPRDLVIRILSDIETTSWWHGIRHQPSQCLPLDKLFHSLLVQPSGQANWLWWGLRKELWVELWKPGVIHRSREFTMHCHLP